MTEIFGTHLLLDGYVDDAERLSEHNLRQMGERLVMALDMTYLGDPICRHVPLRPARLQTGEDEGGLSFIVVITTSHIAVHAWPLRKAFMADVFSCRPFDVEKALSLLREELGCRVSTAKVIHRDDPR